MAWKKQLRELEGLNVPRVAAQLILKWSDDQIDVLFSGLLEVSGQEGLRKWLTEELPSLHGPTGEEKTIEYISEILDEDGKVLINHRTQKFDNEEDFADWRRSLLIGGLLRIGDEQHKAVVVRKLKDLVDGAKYVDAYRQLLNWRVENLEKYKRNDSYAREDEMGKAMLASLKEEGFAQDPILRSDLCLHTGKKDDKPQNQELDVVIFDGKDKAFIGSCKHCLQGTDKVGQRVRDGAIIQERALKADMYPTYKEFAGRRLGLAIRTDHIKPLNEERILKFCGANGVSIYTQSGSSLMRLPNSNARFGYGGLSRPSSFLWCACWASNWRMLNACMT
ncbi:hypothetical protein GOP47_0004035 [Adiantum capillus-veneris]|uniref:Uncharacterized protein n=1 Tax=Adiantum capillus-veneris TaxID=13818 RepID=A0A9D4V7D9_ADICA|nr:hypothetical protein GOP47_0004035 [Adiantum capillus-veneris]